MKRHALQFRLSQGDSPEDRKCGGARNHHITDFFKPCSQPATDALLSALSGTLSSESMKLHTQDVPSWNEKSVTSRTPRKILTSSANTSPSAEPSLSVRKENQTIVRKIEEFCPKCGKSLLSPRVLLRRLILPVNSQVYLKSKGGYKMFSNDSEVVPVTSADAGQHSPSVRHRSRNRSKSALTLLGRSPSCKKRYFENICQSAISRQKKCCPLKSLNLLRSDLQAPLDLCQDEITLKKNMHLVVNLGNTGSNQSGQQVTHIASVPGDSMYVQSAHPELRDCSSFPDADEVHAKKSKRSSYRAEWQSSDSEESLTAVSLSSDDDEEEETFKPLDEILEMATKTVPATPEKGNLNLSSISLSQSPLITTPSTRNVRTNFQTSSPYVNNLDRLVKEQEESKRLGDMEKVLREGLDKGLGVNNEELEDTAEDGKLTDEHREFLDKFKLDANAIPDQHPGEEIFYLPQSGAIFNLRTLDLKHSEFSAGSSEENLIFSCNQENQIMLATDGFLTFLYRFKKCPDFLMRWLFQMVSIHPSYAVSVKLLHTLIEITCNSLTNLQEKPWTPSLLDIATVFANMGIHFDILFPLPHIRPSFSSVDLEPALPLAGLFESRQSDPVFSQVPESQIAHVIKFLGFCSTICRESFCDLEILALIVLLLKLHLEKELKDFPVMDLHCLIEALLQNIKSWETVMPEMFYAISELSTHHHNYIKLLQLIPTSVGRGRQLRKHLSLIFMSNILYGNCTDIPLDYDSQMVLLSELMSQMRPSSLVKEMQKCPENMSKTSLDLDQEAYYRTFSLLHLVNDASNSDEPPSIQRKYLQKLCTELEKHIKSDIREDTRYFYRTKVKDLVARIHGRWQELLLYSRPNQGKLHDYWQPVCDSSSPQSSQENISDEPQDFPYDDN
ncbi:SMC5-SMC6 complex localization factor protein 2 isoform X1 [Eleutherodactylus coqui]|uniref:SMC5-SMC6 complex localization factor protein 2 isoform X1 n=2 Tax=Eleutherodactylus coqui TaxID=57060 RepID=UPI0034619D9F